MDQQQQPDDTRSRGGRPRNDVPASTVSTWLPADEHDALIAKAKERGASVSHYVRDLIRADLGRPLLEN